MAYQFTNINVVPLSITGAVDAEGAAAPLDLETIESVVWGTDNANGMDLGTVEADPENHLNATFTAGVAGAEGYVTCDVTLTDGRVLNGRSDLVRLTNSEAVAFTIGFGDPQ